MSETSCAETTRFNSLEGSEVSEHDSQNNLFCEFLKNVNHFSRTQEPPDVWYELFLITLCYIALAGGS